MQLFIIYALYILYKKSKLDYYRGKDSMKIFCKDLKEHATEKINFEKKKEMMPLSIDQNESYLKQKVCHICKKRIYYRY